METTRRMSVNAWLVYILLSCTILQLSTLDAAANTSSSSFASSASTPSSASVWSSIGVNFGQLADNLPPPHEVVKLMQSTRIGKIRIFNTDPKFLGAFANTGIDVVVGLNNDQVPLFAAKPSLAQQWVAQNIAPFPATRIRLITVGNEVFTSNDQQLSSSILPAMQNIHSALQLRKLHDSIKVSTPHSFALLADSFPPSSGSFHPDTQALVRPLLKFLHDTGAPLLVNAYPYFAYRGNPKEIPLPYLMFLPNPGAVDQKTGLIYTNMFTAQIDAAYSAMEKMGYYGIPVSVTETGWPSGGDEDEVGVNVQNAMTFNRNLVAHVASDSGTPLRPRQPVDTFIFALFNENLKPGPGSERNYGLFKTDGSSVYDCGLMKSGSSVQETSSGGGYTSRSSSDSGGYSSRSSSHSAGSGYSSRSSASGSVDPKGSRSTSPLKPSSSSSSSSSGKSWCVARPSSDAGTLYKALNYACGRGEADCSMIQPGGPCYYPNDINSHASYAFNMYYQKYGHDSWNCNFGSTAITTQADPSSGSCSYPAQ